MRTIDYSDVLQRAAEASGRIYTELSVQEAGLFKGFGATRLKQIWEKQLWPDLMLVEERKFRPDWSSATTYAAGAEVYFTPTRKYYQSLAGANTNHAPATGTPLVENSQWWAESKTTYAAEDYDNTKLYAAGNQVYYASTGQSYQARTAGSGNVPAAGAFWGLLQVFNRYVAWEQSGLTPISDVVGAFNRNPDIDRRALELAWAEEGPGIHVYDDVPTAWIKWRRRVPFLKGANYDASKAYVAGEQVYYSQTSAAGNVTANFYDCIANAPAGQAPTVTTYWAKVEIPFNFGEWLIHAAAADMLSKDGKDTWAEDEMALANEALIAELDKLERQQRQETPFEMRTRHAVC